VRETAGSELSIRDHPDRLQVMTTKGMKTMNSMGHSVLFQIANDKHQALIQRAEERARHQGYPIKVRIGLMNGTRRFVGGGLIAAGNWIHGRHPAREIAGVDTVDCFSTAH